MGVAVQTAQGLVVPVVRRCDTKTTDEIHAELVSLAERARDGNLAPEELRGSTFTVTSAGKLGGLSRRRSSTTPRWRFSPSAGLLHGQWSATARSRSAAPGTVALTFDHRVIDGARAAEFGLAVIERLEGARGG